MNMFTPLIDRYTRPHVYAGANGNFILYEDEFDNYNYEKGVYRVLRRRHGPGVVRVARMRGELCRHERGFRLVGDVYKRQDLG